MPKTYQCEACAFSSIRRQNYENHLKSVKHNEVENIKLPLKYDKPNEIDLLKLDFQQKIKEHETIYDLKLALLEKNFENKLLEFQLNTIKRFKKL